MTIADASVMLLYLVKMCAAPALLINLTQFGVNAFLSAITGRGLRLDGR